MRYAGFAAAWDEIVFEGDVNARKFVAYYIKDNRYALCVCLLCVAWLHLAWSGLRSCLCR